MVTVGAETVGALGFAMSVRVAPAVPVSEIVHSDPCAMLLNVWVSDVAALRVTVPLNVVSSPAVELSWRVHDTAMTKLPVVWAGVLGVVAQSPAIA